MDGAFVVEGESERSLGHSLRGADGREGDGVFASWSWDGRRLRVRNDRLGVYPLFYAVLADGIAVSDSLVRLLRGGASTDLDVEALLVFRSLGFFLGDDTPFKHIKALPPSADLVWDGDMRISTERQLGGALSLTLEEAIDEYARIVRTAIGARLTDTPFAVLLSGGRDSRHILLELLAAGQRPAFCVTARNEWSYAKNNDVEVARMVASHLELPHVEAPRLARFEAERRKNLLTNFCADEHGWLVSTGDVLRERVGAFYDGIGGDVYLLQTRELLDLYEQDRLDTVAKLLLGDDGASHPEFSLPCTLSRHEIRELRTERVVTELRRYAGATNPISMFYFYNRTRREIALSPFGVLRTGGTAYCPYLDYALFDFLASLPPALTLDDRLRTETIARVYPRFGDVPYSTSWRAGERSRELERFAFDVLRHGLAARPLRAIDAARLVGQEGRRAVDETYRSSTKSVDPLWLLYLWQLEDVVRLAERGA